VLRSAAAVVFVLVGAVGFLPLFGGPGYEHALASGVVVPTAAAIAVCLSLSRGLAVPPIEAVRRGAAWGAALAGVAYVTSLLHGLRVGICDFWGGTLLFLLTAGVGSVMGGVWGALVAPLARRARPRTLATLACVLLGLAGPVAGIAVSVARFYGSPMVFAYDPFFGYFSGTLYDTVVDARPELWTYRAGSLATLAGVAFVAAAWPEVLAARRSAGRLVAGVCLLGASAAHVALGPVLGHWQSSASIARELGGRASGPRCDVVHPDVLTTSQADLLLRDCEEELGAVEARLGGHLDGRLTAFVFADADQKRRLMGAADVSIAKPWRREVYVQMASYPHPVLGHEIAHVVAGTFARGVFHVAGAAGGLWPNPGLIEGTAVAASPDDDELTDAQWARAMLDAGLLPAAGRLFSMAFLGQSADRSYTAAGAFVGWVLERWGSGVLRAWYRGGSIESLTEETLAGLDDAFRAWLRTLPMPEEAVGYARAKFERPGVWERKCPHTVDALDRAGDRCRDQHAIGRAIGVYGDALAQDPRDWHARMDRDRVRLRFLQGIEQRAGREDLARIAADLATPRTWRDRALEALADADALEGRADAAASAYRDIAARTVDEDAARTLEVKAIAMDDPSARRAIVDLLIGDGSRSPDSWLGAWSLGDWEGRDGSPVAAYLAGKNLGRHDEWARAAALLDEAIATGLPTTRMLRETLRQRVIAACVTHDVDALARTMGSIAAPDSPFATGGGRREWLLRLAARCAPR
jgi:hypothetical protein